MMVEVLLQSTFTFVNYRPAVFVAARFLGAVPVNHGLTLVCVSQSVFPRKPPFVVGARHLSSTTSKCKEMLVSPGTQAAT